MSFPAYNGQGVRGTNEVPLKLTTFSNFRDHFLNKIIIEIGEIYTKKFLFFAKADQSPWQSWMGAFRIAPLDSALFVNSFIRLKHLCRPIASPNPTRMPCPIQLQR